MSRSLVPFPDDYLIMYVTLIPEEDGGRESLLGCDVLSLGVLAPI